MFCTETIKTPLYLQLWKIDTFLENVVKNVKTIISYEVKCPILEIPTGYSDLHVGEGFIGENCGRISLFGKCCTETNETPLDFSENQLCWPSKTSEIISYSGLNQTFITRGV